MSATESLAQAYWNRLQMDRLKPNFWMSTEYIFRKGLVWERDGELEGWKEEPGDNTWFFPPTYANGLPEYNAEIYAGKVAPAFLQVRGQEKLDLEFLYDPLRFQDLSGPAWAVYRKNIRKYERRFPGRIDYRALEDGEKEADLERMLLKWTEGKEIWDAEVMASFVLFGRHRLVCSGTGSWWG